LILLATSTAALKLILHHAAHVLAPWKRASSAQVDVDNMITHS
jgi:hypothetical protein